MMVDYGYEGSGSYSPFPFRNKGYTGRGDYESAGVLQGGYWQGTSLGVDLIIDARNRRSKLTADEAQALRNTFEAGLSVLFGGKR